MDNPIRMRVKESVMEIFTDILSDEDSIGLVIFNNEVKELLPLSSKKDLRLPMMSALMKGITCEGQTALWDGLYEGFKLLCNRKHQDHHPYLIVVTDDRDNASKKKKKKKEEVRDTLAKPGEAGFRGTQASNFHMDFLTVGAKADQEGAKELCCKGHMKHLHAATTAEIRSTFRFVLQRPCGAPHQRDRTWRCEEKSAQNVPLRVLALPQ